jgi:hypothetical protein
MCSVGEMASEGVDGAVYGAFASRTRLMRSRQGGAVEVMAVHCHELSHSSGALAHHEGVEYCACPCSAVEWGSRIEQEVGREMSSVRRELGAPSRAWPALNRWWPSHGKRPSRESLGSPRPDNPRLRPNPLNDHQADATAGKAERLSLAALRERADLRRGDYHAHEGIAVRHRLRRNPVPVEVPSGRQQHCDASASGPTRAWP